MSHYEGLIAIDRMCQLRHGVEHSCYVPSRHMSLNGG